MNETEAGLGVANMVWQNRMTFKLTKVLKEPINFYSLFNVRKKKIKMVN